MIRTPPQHNVLHPPGQVKWSDPPLAKAIDEYKKTEEYRKGFSDGWNKAMESKFPQPHSDTLY